MTYIPTAPLLKHCVNLHLFLITVALITDLITDQRPSLHRRLRKQCHCQRSPSVCCHHSAVSLGRALAAAAAAVVAHLRAAAAAACQ
jgi:hypothetical protein